jgi:CRISPR system Cascade subunit CasE
MNLSILTWKDSSRIPEPYQLKCLVAQAFPDTGGLADLLPPAAMVGVRRSDRANFLYRRSQNLVVVQSGPRPNWGRVDLRDLACPPAVVDTPSKYPVGTQLRFNLLANPVRQTPTGDVPYDEPLEWLKRQTSRGFDLLEARVDSTGTLYVRKADRKFSVAAAEYAGQMRVTDSALFEQTVITGLGRQKCWGLGLLVLARPDKK